jgi:putative DNA primase/helicase
LKKESEPVFLVEGEKCVCRLETLGFLVTTSAHGAKGARITDWSPLAGRFVVILPDNDDSGQTYQDTSASCLMQLSPRTMVKVLRLPGLPEKGDIVDWLDARNGKPVEEIKAELLELVKNAEAAREPQKQSTEAKSTAEEKRFSHPSGFRGRSWKKHPTSQTACSKTALLSVGRVQSYSVPQAAGKAP